ncbi:MAG: NAD-dependent deacylase [Acidobacteriia bacterium]|nr:NAD-dependent deacylase [Terriglobia bacterium]
MDSLQKRLAEASELIKSSKWLVAFTGAGISTESGLADFRSPGGVWDRHRVVTFQEFLRDHEARVAYWTMKREFYNEFRNAKPNKAHLALAELERTGKLKAVITQNIDGLHQAAGSAPGIVIELHGTNRKAHCLDCGTEWPFEEVQVRLEAGDLDPKCKLCDGLIKPSTISFGQAMPQAELTRAYECASKCDRLLMIGSSLQVAPASSIPPLAHESGAKLIFINRTKTPWDQIAAVTFQESAGEVMDALVARFRGDSPGGGPARNCVRS